MTPPADMLRFTVLLKKHFKPVSNILKGEADETVPCQQR